MTVVLLTYPKEAFGVCTALKAYLCSDLSLSDEKVLEHYSHRWKIEVMFKQQKQYLGLKSFLIRSAKAIDRFLIILTLAWFWFTRELGFYFLFLWGFNAIGGFCLFFEFDHLEKGNFNHHFDKCVDLCRPCFAYCVLILSMHYARIP